jgi:hypothetical protein
MKEVGHLDLPPRSREPRRTNVDVSQYESTPDAQKALSELFSLEFMGTPIDEIPYRPADDREGGLRTSDCLFVDHDCSTVARPSSIRRR